MIQNPLRSHPSVGPDSLNFNYKNNNTSAVLQSLEFERQEVDGRDSEDLERGRPTANEGTKDAGTSMDLDGSEADWVKQELRGL